MKKISHYLRTYLLWELLKGLAVTGRHLFKRKVTVFYPEEKTPQSPRFKGTACSAPLCKRRGAVHRLQAL